MEKLKLFYCDEFRPRRAMNSGQAAELFAKTLARRIYGSAGQVATVRLDNWSPNNKNSTYQIFIGRSCDGGVSGCNHWLYISYK